METHEETLARLEDKIDAVYKVAEKTRKYILIMLIASLVMIFLPLIFAGMLIPVALETVGSMYQI